jgi:hypothetical protein
MLIDPNEAISMVERSLGMIPGAVIVVGLLAGPTVLWLLYRFVVQPRTSRYAGGDGGLLWVCSDCRSANDVRSAQCYSCGLEREEMDRLQVYDGEVLVTLTEGDDDWKALPSAPPVPVMAPGATSAAAPAVVSALPPPAGPGVVSALPPPAGPTRPAPAQPRRLVAVGPGRQGARTAPAPGPGSTDGASNGTAEGGSNGHAATPATRPTRKRSKVGGAAEAGQPGGTGVAVATTAPVDEAMDPPTAEA